MLPRLNLSSMRRGNGWSPLTISFLLLTAALGVACERRDKPTPPAATTADSVTSAFIGDGPLRTPPIASYCEHALEALNGTLKHLPSTVAAAPGTIGLKRVDDWLLALDNVSSIAGLYEYVHPKKAVRTESIDCRQQLNNLLSDFMLSKPLHEALKTIPKDVLDAHGQRYLEHMLREFKRSGADLDKTVRARIHLLREQILKAGQEYSLNIREDRRVIHVSVEELAGLPDDYLKNKVEDGKDVVAISTDYPDYQPVMQYAESNELRLRLLKVFLSRARDKNTQALAVLLEKRHELAALLGYDNYAQYAMEYQMAGHPDRVESFINQINQLALERSNRDYGVLLETLRQSEPDADTVGSWQQYYLANTVRQKRFSLDRKEVRNYFRYQRVKRGIFTLVQDLFGIRVRRADSSVQTWHEDVEVYDVYDGEKQLGRFFLDMHPRDDKYQHAAHFGIRTGVQGRQLPQAALVCNFPADPDHPDGALMEHRQVETFLHEFGHLLHSMLGGQQYWSLFSGIATEHDFVEAPSQMLEEWIWDADTLQTFAHNDKGEVIPSDMVLKMNNARDFGRGLWVRNQMFYASLALHYYTAEPDAIDLQADMVALQNRYSPFKYVEDTYFYASFGHLYGYAASYYTYMWSLVIATDMFSEFERHGLRNKEVAQRYRRTVLEPGGTHDAAVLIRNFLGRDYSTEAFIQRLNRP